MNWDEVRFFHAVAKAGSLTQAARVLRVSQPTVGRRIRDLEEDLGARLFNRLNQGYALTDLGHAIFDQAEQMAGAARCISDRIATASDQIVGQIKLTAPDGLGAHWLVPRLHKIKREHPDLDIQLMLSIEMLNLSAGDADLALRMGNPTDENLVGKKVASVPFHLYGSRSYFAKYPIPQHPEELGKHLIIRGTGRLQNVDQNQVLRELTSDAETAVACDSLMAQVNAAEAGMGIVPLPPYLVGEGSDLMRISERVFEVRVPVWLLTRQDLRNCPRVVTIKKFTENAAKRTFATPAALPQVA